jgi:hypothetical protein
MIEEMIVSLPQEVTLSNHQQYYSFDFLCNFKEIAGLVGDAQFYKHQLRCQLNYPIKSGWVSDIDIW